MPRVRLIALVLWIGLVVGLSILYALRPELLEPERVVLNPDCGFAPGSAAKVDIDEVYAKLVNEVEAARRLREKYG